MTKEMILGVLRHLLTAGGGILSANGVASSGEVETGVGAVIALIGLGLSIWDKRKKKG